MKILIMCGGRGSRLGKLTERIPKPLLRLNDRNILEIKIERYLQQGFNHFIACIGYKGEMIKEALEEFSSRFHVEFSDAGEDAGILERLYRAKDCFDDQVMMTYGDTFADIELAQFIEVHKKSDNEATIVVAPAQSPFGLVEFDGNNKVTFFDEKPVLKYYIGYAIIKKSAFDLVPPKIINMPDGEGLVVFYRILLAMRKLGVFYHPGLQITFNTRKELKEAEEKLVRFYTAPEV